MTKIEYRQVIMSFIDLLVRECNLFITLNKSGTTHELCKQSRERILVNIVPSLETLAWNYEQEGHKDCAEFPLAECMKQVDTIKSTTKAMVLSPVVLTLLNTVMGSTASN